MNTFAENFYDKVENFLKANSLYVTRVYTSHEWFGLQGAIVFDQDAVERLILPCGLRLVTDTLNEETKCFFLVDEQSDEYEEIIETSTFWATYKEVLKVTKENDYIYSL